MAKVRATIGPNTPLEVWFCDEARIGQKNSLTRKWAKKGTRPRVPKDGRYKWAYIFGAICPERGVGAGIIMPYCNTHAMQAHLETISTQVAPEAHVLLILDRAGWHTTKKLDVPDNITLLPLPPKCPELNPVENLWQFMRQTYLSNRIFKDYDDIVTASCNAWNNITNAPWRIMSIGLRQWTKGNA